MHNFLESGSYSYIHELHFTVKCFSGKSFIKMNIQIKHALMVASSFLIASNFEYTVIYLQLSKIHESLHLLRPSHNI